MYDRGYLGEGRGQGGEEVRSFGTAGSLEPAFRQSHRKELEVIGSDFARVGNIDQSLRRT